MLKFSANLSYLFQEYQIFDRFKVCQDTGFKGVEYQFPYNDNPTLLHSAFSKTKLEFVLINAPAGNLEKGERGLAGLPEKKDEFKSTIKKALFYADLLNCHRIHVMVGIRSKNIAEKVFTNTLVSNLEYACDMCAKKNIKVLIEPLNPFDVPGYGVSNTDEAKEIISLVNSENLFLQYDLYHGGMNGEDLLTVIQSNITIIDHMQIAGVPGRNEPDKGHLNFLPILKKIDDIEFNGWIGCEYTPLFKTADGLGWMSAFNKNQ